jgi:hypothetical protein
MRISKILAVVAAAVVAVACNGISPTSPGATVPSDDATALAGAKALDDPIPGSDCKSITTVDMVVLPSPPTGTKVQAIYIAGCVPANCRVAPIWSSKPRGRLVPTKDAFIVMVTRTRPPTPVMVTARAPNGVEGHIQIQ